MQNKTLPTNTIRSSKFITIVSSRSNVRRLFIMLQQNDVRSLVTISRLLVLSQSRNVNIEKWTLSRDSAFCFVLKVLPLLLEFFEKLSLIFVFLESFRYVIPDFCIFRKSQRSYPYILYFLRVLLKLRLSYKLRIFGKPPQVKKILNVLFDLVCVF